VHRVVVRTLLALVLLAAAGLIGWRVLAPAEVLSPATDAAPPPDRRGPGVTGKTASAPLIVDGRVRVFAAPRLVKADGPIGAKTTVTPRWSFRRWPQQLNGVVAVDATVVTRWSDGELVALDAGTGRIVWRAGGPDAGGWTGERTGATVVWAPPGLHTAGAVVLARGGGRVSAFDAGTGAARWQGECAGAAFTTTGNHLVCGDVVRDAATGAPAAGWPAGPYTAMGCGVASSGCAGVRDGAGAGWLTAGTAPRRAAALDAPDSTVLLVPRTTASGRTPSAFAFSTGDAVIARSPVTGGELWRWSGPGGATVLGAAPDTVLLLTGDRQLVAVDASSGAVRTQFPLVVGREGTDWAPGGRQVADGHVVVERRKHGEPFSSESFVLAATG
jgi:outer membrane protein assembly factor BamB